MLNFTSAVYLGLQHPHKGLQPWAELTEGIPAALGEPAIAGDLTQRMARLVGCERALFSPSTLHLFWDLFGTGSIRGRPVWVDAGTYPIARWGAERAASKGATVQRFRHYSPEALRAQLLRPGAARSNPVVVCDGLCPGCERIAPVSEYLSVVRHAGGTLLIDDTQALGIYGDRSQPCSPYGAGGGGILRWTGVQDPGIIVISSLAKGFGVPVAVLAGSARAVSRFEKESETRVHCSPPSVAILHAAKHALDVNDRYGDALRRQLLKLVRRFGGRLRRQGIAVAGGLFPLQTIRGTKGRAAAELHDRLLRLGIKTVLHRDRDDDMARVSFVITARHTAVEIDTAVHAVLTAIGAMSRCEAICRRAGQACNSAAAQGAHKI